MPIALRKRFCSSTPSRGGNTRSDSSARIMTRAEQGCRSAGAGGKIAPPQFVADIEGFSDAAAACHADPIDAGLGMARPDRVCSVSAVP
jgi:hypothetical protein